MISFFKSSHDIYFVIEHSNSLDKTNLEKLKWLFNQAEKIDQHKIDGHFVGTRPNMITPWSTNAVEIVENMGINAISRIEKYSKVPNTFSDFDPMLSYKRKDLDQAIFLVDINPDQVLEIENISSYNKSEGLSLSAEEVSYLENLSKKLDRKLTDSEVFGFSQVNSEHCRHKIFNGKFIIDGVEKKESLFQLIKNTTKAKPEGVVSAYKDNVAFVEGPEVTQFAPSDPTQPSYYKIKKFESVLSLKAETHNFPTTVEPFNGAATGSGGEIRDRLAGGQGSIPSAGTAVYMTSYPRFQDHIRSWEKNIESRPWLYQTPLDILIKASNGASDFGNKFGQPLIVGSLFTYEQKIKNQLFAYDKVIMQAGGIGYAKKSQAFKKKPKQGDLIIILGGDNYRIGMGGAAVSSADTGELSSGLELNAVQRSNPEMQKRAANTIRALVESDENIIVSIHDHGAGGHLNCLSELVEETGGIIKIENLPLGDPTLSHKEIIGNESQERMGLIIDENDLEVIQKIADRERTPLFVVGKVTEDHRFVFESNNSQNPIDLDLEHMFGSSPKTVMTDSSVDLPTQVLIYLNTDLKSKIIDVLQLESVACKDWLTNKVDRCVGGKVAMQQCVGELQLPLNNCGIMAIDFDSHKGIATSIGHSPISGMIDASSGAINAIGESLTNLIWAPLEKKLDGVSLSANWMWPCRNPGEDARLYDAVSAVSSFCKELGINVPTGKDSLSMAQKYKQETVLSPGTVIISSVGTCSDFTKAITPVLDPDASSLLYIDMSQDDLKLGGSAFAQSLNQLGASVPSIKNAGYFKKSFNTIQQAIESGYIAAGHDISSGGLITAVLEMCFPSNKTGLSLDLNDFDDIHSILFAENVSILIQAKDNRLAEFLSDQNIDFKVIGTPSKSSNLKILHKDLDLELSIEEMREKWYHTSYLFDANQTRPALARERYENYTDQALNFIIPDREISIPSIILNDTRPKAAIIREKGSNSEREMANALYKAGFDVKDVHMTDLISGRENLQDIRFLGAVGGFSNSDVLGSAKGWAGAFKYNDKANDSLKKFFNRPDTLSVGICNGCQLFLELDLINPDHDLLSKMTYNDSAKHESAFTSVDILKNDSIMLSSLAGANLGVWISHGEGKFHLPMSKDKYNIAAKYTYDAYPSNPNGSDYNAAMIVSIDGRHLATMPHIERSFFYWNWPHKPKNTKGQFSPWAEAFCNAKDWILKN